MAILDRPLFRRPLTKDELRMYGLPAFANGGVVHLKKGGDPLGLFNPGGYAQEKMKEEAEKEESETALTNLVKNNYDDQIIRESKKEVITPEETKEDLPDGPDIKLKTKPSKEEIDAIREQIEGSGETEVDKLKKRFLEKSKLYKEILGDSEKMRKEQGFLQLAQFGLNLASAQGANFLDKVAKSAKDPLNAFAELGRKAFEDERAVELLALEATEDEIEKEKQAEIDKELALLKGDSGTNFQNDLLTIQQILPDLDPLSQAKLAKGLSLPMDTSDRVDFYFETLMKSDLFASQPEQAREKAEQMAMTELGSQSSGDTGGGDDNSYPLGVATEDIVKKVVEDNDADPVGDREDILNGLEKLGYDVSKLRGQ